MTDRLQVLTKEELTLIHNASMDILLNAGICFNSDAATQLFKKHGFRTEGNQVYFTISPKNKSERLWKQRFPNLRSMQETRIIRCR
jgi:trimethylamine--corrinoid protein Co-methyltransferase